MLDKYALLYKELGNGKAIKKGTSFRLSNEYINHLLEYPKQLANKYGIEIFHCKHSLITTK